MTRKIKMTQAASVNGGNFNFVVNQVVSDRDYPAYVLDLLVGGGYAVEIVPEPKRVVEKPAAKAPAAKPAAPKAPAKGKPGK